MLLAGGESLRIEPCAPYEHSQNGFAERAGRTVFEHVAAIIKDSHLPVTFWEESMRCFELIRLESVPGAYFDAQRVRVLLQEGATHSPSVPAWLSGGRCEAGGASAERHGWPW